MSTPDGGYAVLGYRSGETSLPSFVHKINSNFEFEWEQEYNHSEDYVFNYLYDIEVTPDGGFVCAGETTGQNNNTHPQSSWLLKLDACGDLEWQGCDTTTIDVVEEVKGVMALKLYPNPAEDMFHLELAESLVNKSPSLKVRNAIGQEILSLVIQGFPLELDVSSIPSGVYMVSLISDGRELYSERLIIK